ncbi:toll/interleukin-1 receptor domain-containing protein [Aquimarina agarivorans]|uniref:toll/interleukin-1 receptor domain-containing protein n=1 Tax=Aquimarina agarivorans TaxID=980584 RepID=UPI000248F030|nr:toll/interleukin-1 receptor domain-containing protein [Aquimarina agarivorans]
MSNSVFISYSKKDIHFLEALRVHLSYLEREYDFEIWEDSKIEAGDDWRKEIYEAIAKTSIGILMVSANFIASDFITNEELPALLAIAEKKGAKIFSIIISHCMFTNIAPIAKLQSLNPPTQPVVGMNVAEKDAFFLKVTQEVKRALESTENQKFANKKSVGMASGLAQSFIKVFVVQLLFTNTEGLTISDIQKRLLLEKRKYLVQVIQELIAEEMLLKKKIANRVCYYLSDQGATVCSKYI